LNDWIRGENEMLEDRDTWECNPVFRVKDHSSGVWIAIELLDGEPLPPLRNGFLRIELSGTTSNPNEAQRERDLARAHALAERLNDAVSQITFTGKIESQYPPGRGGKARQHQRAQ